jgi:hypothetical protein
MASIRNKTVRRSIHDISGGRPLVDFSTNDDLARLLQAESGQAYKKPWHRLERGLRLNRLRAFADDMGTKRGLRESEKGALVTLLTRALDKKLLNSKTAVEYDPEREAILEIKPLVMHQSATGEVLFQLLEKRNAVTFRKRAPATAAAPQGGPVQSQAGGEEA